QVRAIEVCFRKRVHIASCTRIRMAVDDQNALRHTASLLPWFPALHTCLPRWRAQVRGVSLCLTCDSKAHQISLLTTIVRRFQDASAVTKSCPENRGRKSADAANPA